jgi:hypothetical protein
MSKVSPEVKEIVLRMQERIRKMKERNSALERLLAEIAKDHKERLECEKRLRGLHQNLSSLFDEYSAEVEQDRKSRLTGIVSSNDARQQRATRDRRLYLGIAKELIIKKPHLERASNRRLARAIQSELIKRGRTVSIRTIERAICTYKV